MTKDTTSHHTENTIFWCPPLQGQQRSLTRIWHQFPEQLTSQQQHEFATLANRPLATAELGRANAFLQQWPLWQVSCYNQHRPASQLPKHYVLVICSSAAAENLAVLLAKARDISQQNHNLPVLVAPDNYQNLPRLQQQLGKLNVAADNTLTLLSQPCHHASLIQGASHIVVFNSWLGFEALLWQKPVTVLGSPFYAGLGLTTDSVTSRARGRVSLQQLLFLVLLEYSYSKCPSSDHEIPLEQALNWLSLQNAQRLRFAPHIYAVGFNRHWQSSVRAFFQGSELSFVKQLKQVPPGEAAAIWGARPLLSSEQPATLYRLEDGFLRSVGLGALFAKPLSWVADSRGLYFDATQPSDLEQLLSQHRFSQLELQQAAELRQWLIANKVSKYNVGRPQWQPPATDKKIILVAGQVESDASIALGAPGIKQNMQLLQAVQQRNPGAYIIYKPHPDVVAGARAKGNNEEQAAKYCDEIAAKADISAMLDRVDEVHVITSLAGFEALLRGKKVVCYGLPFYAGWGLTEDIERCSRRNRKLQLDELVAGTLMRYPLYLDANSGYYSSALAVAKQLAHMRNNPKQTTTFWHRTLRKCINLVRGKK